MTSEFSIQVQNVTKSFRLHHERRDSVFEYLKAMFNKKNFYSELTILDNVSFNVKKGEMLGIVGLNGSGKTSLLKIIANIYLPNKGRVLTEGTVTPLLEVGAGFNGELTAYDNIIVYGVLLGFSKKNIQKKIPEIIRFAELEDFVDTKLKNFSAGMYSRLAFSVALATNPDIVLVDEVLSVGDITFQEKSFKEFLKFKNKGKTIVFVSHDSGQIQDLCDQAILLHKGKIYKQGLPKEVLDVYRKLVL